MDVSTTARLHKAEVDAPRNFKLYERAVAAGVISTGNGLIVAPTATGKSYIGRSVIREAVKNHLGGVHAYLVPYRALAQEMYESFKRELQSEGLVAKLKISTGDNWDPVYPEETDILVSTFERFSSILSQADLQVGRVVLDEIHLLADEGRGPNLESLIVRLRTWKRPLSLCALSAVVANPEDLATWLGVPLVRGSHEDRSVQVEFRCEEEMDITGRIKAEVAAAIGDGDQSIVFCNSKASAQKLAGELSQTISRMLPGSDVEALRDAVARFTGAGDAETREEETPLLELLISGVAYHHAGLSKQARLLVENAFRERHLKVICCTPTLAAGVNLPAKLVVVKDVYRTEFVRGYPKKVVLSTGELLNMLGRAGRPGQVDAGHGIALVEPGLLDPANLEKLRLAIREGSGNPVVTKLPESFDAIMRFILQTVSDRGEATMDDIVAVFKASYWFHQEKQEITFDKPLSQDVMEDIPSFKKVTPEIYVEDVWTTPDGVAGIVRSGENAYTFSLGLVGEDCSCPARQKYRRWELCKHLACAINTLLFSEKTPEEIRNRALYVSAHKFRKTLDTGSKIEIALRLLMAWGFVERVPGAYRVTRIGEIAGGSGLDLLLLKTARERIASTGDTCRPEDVAAWVVEDFFAEQSKRDRWSRAVAAWIHEVSEKEIPLPERYRGDFERGLEDLAALAGVYGEIAQALGKKDVAQACARARASIAYGVSWELAPLVALRIPQLGRARCRYLYAERGIRTLDDLADADPRTITGPGVSLALATSWVGRAKEIRAARRKTQIAEQGGQRDAVDDFLASFEVDRMLVTTQGI